ncbi:MAG TPA: hypothetical protein VD788_09065 [Candidatus Polarisedimenticolaceae bacterium]|nr:hypothetical protein [Candidatus Polarisedimenticolaceae bacterium]
MRMIRRNPIATTAVLLPLLGVGFLGFAAGVPDDDDGARTLRERALRLVHGNTCRRAEAELVEGERFYLVLDIDRRSLSLKLGGVMLHELPIESIEVGRPYRFFFEHDGPKPIRARLHRQSSLSPPRLPLRLPVEIPEEADVETQTIMLPPEPETAIAVPRRFFIRYREGVVLEFRTGRRDLGQRINDRVAALFRGPELRLRLVLERRAAEIFYRSVPRETDLLVL